MRRIIQVVLLTVAILVSGLIAGAVMSRAKVLKSSSEDPLAMLGLAAVGGALMVTLTGSQNISRTGRITEHREPELERLKDEFIRNVAHELRTPLTLVRGYVEMLDAEQLDEETRRHAAAIARARTEDLVGLVEAITTMHEVKPGKLDPRPVDLAALARIAVQTAQQKAQRAGVRITLHVPSDLPRVTGDSFYLLQALGQLLDNAIKFSPNGGTVNLRLSAKRNNVRVEITDQGIGIPSGELQRIFERFYQVDGSTTRRIGGMGLGLALVKAIVEAHQGRVRATSAGPDKGSTFVCTVPAQAPKHLMSLHPVSMMRKTVP